MKIFLYAVTVLVLFAGCSKANKVQFCEGVSPEGEGVNCGTRFETGELTAMIKCDKPFETEEIFVAITEVRDKKTEPYESLTVEVNPEEERVNTNLSFYNGGMYRVTAKAGENTIAVGEIEIVDYE